MATALNLARHGLYSTKPNPRVGCVLVKDGRIVGEGFHHHAGGPHAEVVALAQAGSAAAGATAYVTLEPCCHHGRTPPCAEALVRAGVARVVFAVEDPNPRVAGGGGRLLAAAGIAICSGVQETQARVLNRGFFSRLERGLPFTTLKVGMSLDGKTALASGVSQWITCPEARADVQRLRARSCAILTGSGTVLADDPALTVRDARFDIAGKQPLRVILDSGLRVPTSARIFSSAGDTCIFTGCPDGDRISVFEQAGAMVEVLSLDEQRLPLVIVLRRLAALEINELLVEAGPRLSGAMLQANLVDEIVLHVAPKVLGADARSAFVCAPLQTLEAATQLQLQEVTMVGTDLKIVAVPRST